ncbi:MAG: prepilin-type N-terminal cleavage/methylation domain-containing protein [Vicinamibacteria bacterium]
MTQTMTTSTNLDQTRAPRRGDAGFTLMEAIIATLILTIGIMGVANLSVVATTDNSNANRTTAAAFLASQKLEELKATPFNVLADSPSSSLEADQPGFTTNIELAGTGSFLVRWSVTTVAGSPPMKQILVRAESRTLRGRQTRADFQTFRTCTNTPCS